MTPSLFRTLLDKLSDSDWQSVIDGQRIVLIDDQRLGLGGAHDLNAIIQAGDAEDVATLRAISLAEVDDLLSNYYRTHALTEAGFKAQAMKLIAEHGAENFAGPFGPPPARTLFVDGGELVAADRTDPRHRYGAYCEIDVSMPAAALAERVESWIEQGEAHARYMAMNACRYNC
ncbi:MAG: hypothetical protein H6981_03390 [Gammaproteobacteria bacterium]|nr:hypothetical protein [Gammaproteobacteria bacterium]MCP5135833.1 hypothetical protein [Gammaproteobacteria bacterium]